MDKSIIIEWVGDYRNIMWSDLIVFTFTFQQNCSGIIWRCEILFISFYKVWASLVKHGACKRKFIFWDKTLPIVSNANDLKLKSTFFLPFLINVFSPLFFRSNSSFSITGWASRYYHKMSRTCLWRFLYIWSILGCYAPILGRCGSSGRKEK